MGAYPGVLAACFALLVLLLTFLLICTHLIPFTARWTYGTEMRGRAPTSQGLPVFPLAGLRAAVLDHPEEPWLVTDLPTTPPVRRWGEWGVNEVRVLFSPTGVFGSYADCEWDTAADDKQLTGVRFKSQHCQRDARCEARHFLSRMDLVAALQAFADPESHGGTHAYLRGSASDAYRAEAEAAIGGLKLRNLAPYLSSAGCVTNLHWDAAAGVLAQTRGEKDVSLFAPSEMPDAAIRDSPCHRRSYQSGRACPEGATMQLRLFPGWGVYIPRHWAHHIVSLSAETLGAVWRLTA